MSLSVLLLPLLGVLVFYWVLRLSIGHGIDDALKKAELRQSHSPKWVDGSGTRD